MALLRATVSLVDVGGLARDEAKNVWHFSTASGIDTNDMSEVGNALAAFYGGAGGISQDLASSVKRGVDTVHRVDFAEVTRGAPGESDDTVSPIISTRPFAINVGGPVQPLPAELACCLSFRGNTLGVPEEQGLIRPKSRLRGRIFIGPLGGALLELDNTTKRPKFTQAFRDRVITSYNALLAEIDDSPLEVSHVVYSRANASSAIVVNAHVDEEPDTIRRRGRKSEQRSVQTVIQPPLVP